MVPLPTLSLSKANMTHIRKSRLGSGLSLQVKVLETVEIVPSSLGGGR